MKKQNSRSQQLVGKNITSLNACIPPRCHLIRLLCCYFPTTWIACTEVRKNVLVLALLWVHLGAKPPKPRVNLVQFSLGEPTSHAR